MLKLARVILLVLLPWLCIRHVRAQTSVPPDTQSGFLPGLATYFAGNGTPYGTDCYSDNSSPTQVCVDPDYIVLDSHGNIYLADFTEIWMVYAGGPIPQALANVTVAATPAVTPQIGNIYLIAGLTGNSCGGSTDPTLCGEGLPLNQVSFSSIGGLAIDANNNLYYSDQSSTLGTSEVVREVAASTSIVTTVAGQLGGGTATGGIDAIGDGGPATGATLSAPFDVKVDSFGNLFIADYLDNVVRVFYSGTKPPPILAAEGVVDQNSTPPLKEGYIYAVAGQTTAFCTVSPTSGSAGSPGACGDYGPATTGAGLLGTPQTIAVDDAGNLYVTDNFSFLVSFASLPAAQYLRIVYAGGAVPPLLNLALNPNGGSQVAPTPGYIYAVTGYGVNPQFASCSSSGCGDGGLAANMQLGNSASNSPIVLDSLGNVYISDGGDFALRKIDISGYASTVAGIDNPNQTPPSTLPPPEGMAATSTYMTPGGFAFDSQDNLYLTSTDLAWKIAPLQPQSITFPAFDPGTVTYGVSSVALSASASSNLPISYSVSGPGKVVGTELVVTGAGTITVTASQAGNDQYAAASPQTQTLAVNPAPLTVTAVDASKVVGTPNPAFSAIITGFVNGDTSATPGVYSGAPSFTTPATTSSPVGPYPIYVSIGTLSSKNYTFTSFVAGTLTVTGTKPQTITFAPLSPVNYGHAPIALGATTSSGLTVSFRVTSGPGFIPSGSSTLTITGAGTIAIVAFQEGNNTYEAATSVTQNLTVNQAQLIVTGPTVSLVYGSPIDPTTFPAATISGLVGSDTSASVVAGAAVYTTVTGTPNVGSYPITVGLGNYVILPGASANYTFGTPVNGTLNITQAPQTITFTGIPSGQMYGGNPQILAISSTSLPITFTATGPVNLTFEGGSPTVPSGTPLTVDFTGVGTATITANQPGDKNHAAAPPVTQTVLVGPAPLNIAANNAAIAQGAPLPNFTYTIGVPSTSGTGGFLNGDSDIPSVISGIPSLVTTATQDSPPGSYNIVPTQGTLSASNYHFVFIPATLTINPPGAFTISASPASLTVPSGQNRQATLTLTPTNLYQGIVTLSCGQLAANVTCVLSPATVSFPGNQATGSNSSTEYPAQVTLTIAAASVPAVGALRNGDGEISRAAILIIPGALAGLMLALRRRSAGARGVWQALAFLIIGAGALMVSSCGGSSNMSNAAPGTATVMINGSGTTPSGTGSVTASVPISVTIQ